jgi:hypothetical protein
VSPIGTWIAPEATIATESRSAAWHDIRVNLYANCAGG